jgi:hypothetical protein
VPCSTAARHRLEAGPTGLYVRSRTPTGVAFWHTDASCGACHAERHVRLQLVCMICGSQDTTLTNSLKVHDLRECQYLVNSKRPLCYLFSARLDNCPTEGASRCWNAGAPLLSCYVNLDDTLGAPVG